MASITSSAIHRRFPASSKMNWKVLRAVTVRNGRIDVTLSQGVQVREAFRASPEIYSLGAPLVDERKISYQIGDLEAGVPGSVLLTLVLPPRKPGPVRISSNFSAMKSPASASALPRST